MGDFPEVFKRLSLRFSIRCPTRKRGKSYIELTIDLYLPVLEKTGSPV